jgi:hypothetical protein
MLGAPLDAAYVAELHARQAALQREAETVIAELGLWTALAQIGQTHQLGSSVSGLMVWRDLDFIIICDPALPLAQIMGAVRPIFTHPRTVDCITRMSAAPTTLILIPRLIATILSFAT